MHYVETIICLRNFKHIPRKLRWEYLQKNGKIKCSYWVWLVEVCGFSTTFFYLFHSPSLSAPCCLHLVLQQINIVFGFENFPPEYDIWRKLVRMRAMENRKHH